MIEIFISYRHSDEHAVRLAYVWLTNNGVDKDVIFYDETGIPPGHHFPTKINAAATQAKIMIVFVGPKWATVKRHWYSRKTRIKEDDDWVRKEIGVALATGTEILPVNIENTSVPKPHELPPELQELCSAQFLNLSSHDPSFTNNMLVMARRIDEILPGRYPHLLNDPIIFDAPRQNELFTGREDILNEIHTRFTKVSPGKAPRVVALTGLGGLGKTQTAITYAHRYHDDANGYRQAGQYFREQSRFRESEPLLTQALAILKQLEHLSVNGPLATASGLDRLAKLYFDQYLYKEAESRYRQALAIRERLLDPEDAKIPISLNRLGLTLWYMGNTTKSLKDKEQYYAEAEHLYEHALLISLKLYSPEHPLPLNIQNNQGLLYRSQKKYTEAIAINKKVLPIREKLPDQALEVAQSLQNLAVTYLEQGETRNLPEAERLLEMALAIRLERWPNKKHVQVARCYRYLGRVYRADNKVEQAEQYYKEGLAIWNEVLEDPFQILEVKTEYADLLRTMNRNDEATIIEAEISTAEKLQKTFLQE